MKIALLRVGIDSGSGGIHAPLFADGSFEFIPIPDDFGLDRRTYGNTRGRFMPSLLDYFPERMKARMANQSVHYDPEFETFTYGDPTSPKAGLRRLEQGDLLVFYGGLQGFDHVSPPELYLIGYFEVMLAGIASHLSDSAIDLCRANFHVMHQSVFARQKTRLILIKGGDGSRLFNRAVRISSTGTNRLGKPLKILSPKMAGIFGSFGGKESIQRSNPRWVSDGHIGTASHFVRGLY